MELLTPVPLTRAGRPILFDGEVEVRIASSIALWTHHQKKPKSELMNQCLTILTNCRIFFIVDGLNSTAETGWSVSLSDIRHFEDCSSFMQRSQRISIFLNTGQELGIKYLDSGKEEFLKLAQEVLSKRSWERITMTFDKSTPTQSTIESNSSKPEFSSSHAGISGIIRKQEKDLEAVDNLRRTALSDLNSLMKSASEVVKVIEKYSVLLEERRNNSAANETESILGDTNEIEELLQNIGMVSPVTRLSAGRVYYQQLARQIADIMLMNDRLQKLGGMISLPDLYCLVNRARGTELLSPEDLYKACETINSFHLGVLFKRFPSGVMVLQLDSLTDRKLLENIREIFSRIDNSVGTPKDGSRKSQFIGISISSASLSLKLSVIVTKEVLLEAERRFILCRDESPDGLKFHLNRFPLWE